VKLFKELSIYIIYMDEIKKKEYNKKYYEEHKEHLHDMKMLHKEETKKYNKKYYENKKKELINCQTCNKEFNYYSLS